jgi:AraC-like DNA-binding protein
MKAQRTITRSEDEITNACPVCVRTYAFERLDGSTPWETGLPPWSCGKVLFFRGYPEIPPHNHDHYEIELVIGGSAVHSTPEGETVLKPGDIHVVAPGEVHSFDRIDGLFLVHCVYIGEWLAADIGELLYIDGLVPLFLPTVFINEAHRVRVPQWYLHPPQLENCLQELRDIAAECTATRPSHQYLKWSLKKLMLYLCRAYRESDSSSLLPIRPDMRRAVMTVEDHVLKGEPLDAFELARNLKMSPATFSRVFKETTGYSPMQYFQRRRVERASWLLRDSSRSITSVAYELGYSDASYFSRMFRRHFGLSPAEFAGRFSQSVVS